MFWWILISSALLLTWIMYSLFMSRTPELAYVILNRFDGFEIRDYESHIRISISVKNAGSNSYQQGINALIQFLSGENEEHLQIKLIAPFMIEQKGEESIISVAVPVQFTLANLPKPKNPSIQFYTLPSKQMAVKTYSWFNFTGRFSKKRSELLDELNTAGIKVNSICTEAIFQTEWILPNMCKYEVMAEIV